MALPPVAAPSPAGPSPVPPPAMAGEEPAEETEGEPEVVATILKNGDGTFSLQVGDEPEGDDMAEPGAAPAPETFDNWQDLVRAVIALEGGGAAAADAAFDVGFKGGKGAPMPPPAAGPKPPMV